MTSSYSADGLREQSQESADSADALCVEIQLSQDTRWKHMFNTSWTTRRKQQQHPVVSSIELAVAIYPVASFSVIVYPVDLVPRRKKRRSRRSIETQPVASYSIQSQEIQAQRIVEIAKRSSRSDGSAAKQLTTYEELSKLDVNC
ncbi:hypothetical protein F511_15874 [Dorcoceras hygrometricum]|uniref:Uncharacterized protein n=1 Tax=Dorcoceras hygrometricum TaxID=472368 RepID=A0A2Z7B8Z6_9LAMI|nr:hypothetical protein F511_15874 [Dorcoceras hygrometricum]